MSKNKRGGYEDDDNRRKKSRRDHVPASYHDETADEYNIRQQDGAHHRRVEKFCQEGWRGKR